MKTKVAHLTSHHNFLDNRIFYRECRTLAAAGYDVILVAQNEHDEVREGIQIRAVPPHRGRLGRVTLTAFRVALRAWRERPAVFHFHDPELIPWGLLFRLLGKRVVYDVHEDFTQAADVRQWLPGFARHVVAGFVKVVEWLARKSMDVVIAERYYERRFPGATPVLNYPDLEQSAALQMIQRQADLQPERIRLLYVGSVTPSRGALVHAELASRLPGCEIMMCGICEPAVVDQIRSRLGNATLGIMDPEGRIQWEGNATPAAGSTLILEGVGFYVPPKSMIRHFRQAWTAGIAIFPPTQHYYEKELTKFFEYMAAGLPIVCSNFPTWRNLVETTGAGITVDPGDADAIVSAVRRLHASPDLAIGMGNAGRRAVRHQFHWQSQAANLLALYARLTGEAPSAAAATLEPTRGGSAEPGPDGKSE